LTQALSPGGERNLQVGEWIRLTLVFATDGDLQTILAAPPRIKVIALQDIYANRVTQGSSEMTLVLVPAVYLPLVVRSE